MTELTPEFRDNLYRWLDSIPFSRPKKKLARYFADASAVAELISFCIHKKFVYENAYPPAMSLANKIDNWKRLNRKVLKKLGINLAEDQINNLADAKLVHTEVFLFKLAIAIYSVKYNSIRRVLEDSRTEEDFEEYLNMPSYR